MLDEIRLKFLKNHFKKCHSFYETRLFFRSGFARKLGLVRINPGKIESLTYIILAIEIHLDSDGLFSFDFFKGLLKIVQQSYKLFPFIWNLNKINLPNKKNVKSTYFLSTLFFTFSLALKTNTICIFWLFCFIALMKHSFRYRSLIWNFDRKRYV